MRSGIDETRDPKYAHIERERRWLVDATLRPYLTDLPFTLIEDSYIANSRVRLRRMTDSRTGAQALKLTKKYETADPLARPIVTAYLSDAEFTVFGSLPSHQLTKRRYGLREQAIEFSLDRFLGPLDGLELAEIEWPDDEGLRQIPMPTWAIRDVSDDVRYQGGALSNSGLPRD